MLSDSKNKAALATSSTFANFSKGLRLIIDSSLLSSKFFVISVSIYPGAKEFTVIPAAEFSGKGFCKSDKEDFEAPYMLKPINP